MKALGWTLTALGVLTAGAVGVLVGVSAPWRKSGTTTPAANGTAPATGSSSWVTLDPTSSIGLQPGNWYAVTALVKSTHDEAAVAGLANSYGLVFQAYTDPADVSSYTPALPAAPDGYRYVAGIVQATKAATLPVAAPWPLGALDGSKVVSALVAQTPAST